MHLVATWSIRDAQPKPVLNTSPPIKRSRGGNIALSASSKDWPKCRKIRCILRSVGIALQEHIEVIAHSGGRADSLDPLAVLLQTGDPLCPTVKSNPYKNESFEHRAEAEGLPCSTAPAINQQVAVFHMRSPVGVKAHRRCTNVRFASRRHDSSEYADCVDEIWLAQSSFAKGASRMPLRLMS
jgi:hypothetical protein